MLSYNNYQTVLPRRKEMELIRLLIVDDYAVIRKGITQLLKSDPTIQIVGEAVDGVDAIYQAQQLQPDVILMELNMPRKNGIEAIIELRKYLPEVKIIVLSSFDDEPRGRAAIMAGANGYLLKNVDREVLLQAIHQVVQNNGMPLHPKLASDLFKYFNQSDRSHHAKLSTREKEVLQLLTQGLSNKKIAHTLSLTTGTVKVHVTNILSKLKVDSRTQAARQAIQLGLVKW